MRVGINGWGRIGRCIARQIMDLDHAGLDLVKINSTGDEFTNTWLLDHDSVHGRWTGQIKKGIQWTAERDIDTLDWSGVDIVLECTGVFNSRKFCQTHIDNGAKMVLISAPMKTADRTVVYGVNDYDLTSDDNIVSAASCTTNCLAPIAKVLNQAFDINSAQMTTIHSYTGDQPTIDRRHKDLYRARAAMMSMIPTSTGAAKAIGYILPELEGKITGSAVRVPTPNVSAIDLSFMFNKPCTVDDINEYVYNASKHGMAGIIEYDDGPKVSIDFNTTDSPCIFAPQHTRVVGNLARVFCWYDNEWAYASQMVETARVMGGLRP